MNPHSYLPGQSGKVGFFDTFKSPVLLPVGVPKYPSSVFSKQKFQPHKVITISLNLLTDKPVNDRIFSMEMWMSSESLNMLKDCHQNIIQKRTSVKKLLMNGLELYLNTAMWSETEVSNNVFEASMPPYQDLDKTMVWKHSFHWLALYSAMKKIKTQRERRRDREENHQIYLCHNSRK